jgi:hypothetical protein
MRLESSLERRLYYEWKHLHVINFQIFAITQYELVLKHNFERGFGMLGNSKILFL